MRVAVVAGEWVLIDIVPVGQLEGVLLREGRIDHRAPTFLCRLFGVLAPSIDLVLSVVVGCDHKRGVCVTVSQCFGDVGEVVGVKTVVSVF